MELVNPTKAFSDQIRLSLSEKDMTESIGSLLNSTKDALIEQLQQELELMADRLTQSELENKSLNERLSAASPKVHR